MAKLTPMQYEMLDKAVRMSGRCLTARQELKECCKRMCRKGWMVYAGQQGSYIAAYDITDKGREVHAQFYVPSFVRQADND